MARFPSKLAAASLMVVAFGGLLAWFTVPLLLADKTPILSDFLDVLQAQSKELTPGNRVPVPLPPLADGELVVVAMNLYATRPPDDIRLTRRALTRIFDDTVNEGAALTFVYVAGRGDLRGRQAVSRCNLAIAPGAPLVIAPTAKSAFLECGPTTIPSRGQECREIVVGLWNERCSARLVVE